MKYLNCLLILWGLFSFAYSQETKNATEAPAFPNSGVHVHLSSNGVVPIMGTFNVEHYWHFRENKLHWGLGGGGYVGTGEYDIKGLHAMGNLWTGKKSHHFEMRLGAAFNVSREESFVVPILQLGYRYQKPGERGFFYADLGSAGIGVGAGVAL